ncbi:MAG: cohesin domain-containing protein [Candidatus Methylumidiphilus sp.]
MNKHLLPRFIALLACCFLSDAQAALLTTEMPNGLAIYTTALDSMFDAKIMINSVPDLGSIDFTLTYDNSKLNALSIDSGFIFDAANTYTPSGTPTWTGGTIHFAEAIEGTSPLTAGINVTAPTLVATIHFKAMGIAAGVNNVINPTGLTLSDFDGNSVGGSFQQAFVTVTQPAAAVPVPATIWLFGLGLAGLGFFGKRRKTS